MIGQLQAQTPLSRRALCHLLAVNRAWYYAAQHRTPDTAATTLRAAIEEIILGFPGYGYRRVTHELAQRGQPANHKRVLRIMREESLLCHLKRYVLVTTHSQHGEGRYPNLLKGLLLERLNQAWVADLTYIHLPGGFVYLAAILDAYSRRCVGWALSREITSTLTLAALNDAIAARHPPPGVIHHSDQGVQYASAAYVERLHAAGLQPSMSAKGNPYDNAKAERFFRTMVQLQIISFV